jgi:LPPG:FO 2-phospho-L-lactate transferase
MILALAGGVGGAKLAHGLQRTLRPEDLVTVVNTGDDFDLYGLRICPDLDTVTYTLSGRANPDTGWGLAGESWTFVETLRALGADAWFQLGDRDLATHALRTGALQAGKTLSTVTADLAHRMGVPSRIVPMTDDPVRTIALTVEGELAFQEYFVRRRSEPVMRALRYEGVERARPSPGFDAALADSALQAIVICPSNPFLSVAPILALPGVRERVRKAGVPVVAVSPIVGGRAVKGPAAKLMREFGLEVSARGIATYYGDLIDGLVIDAEDAHWEREIAGPHVMVAPSMMRTDEDRAALARDVLDLVQTLWAQNH